jgi:uncharacterized protein YjcR
MAYSDDTINTAKSLFIRAHKPAEIAARLKVSERTVYDWIKKNEWEELLAFDTVEVELGRRISLLTNRENKTKEEVLELEKLCKIFGSMRLDIAKADKIQAEADVIRRGDSKAEEKAVRNAERRENRKKGKPARNDISELDLSKFDDWADKNLFEYQKLWREVAHDPERNRNRFILKSRQIGATYYFAFEAFEDAVKNGKNQIFLSASKPQARVFKAYIQAFAREQFDLELKGGDFIELFKDGKVWATLYFLSTNTNTAQSYTGNLYIDEVFWIPNYEKLENVASGMAGHKHWRRTYFSTPSSKQHSAYDHWTGERFNKKRKRKVEIDIRDETVKQGSLGPDKVWRHLVTVQDAERMGCDLFDIAELLDEYSKDVFDNLFGCKFIDENEAVFPFSVLKKCMADVFSKWTDVDFEDDRPVGNRPVAVGYDPSRIRDNAALVVVQIPLSYRERWRVLETHQFKGMTSEYQAERIRELYNRYNVTWVGIDTTGIGHGVFDLVSDLPEIVPIHYSLEAKTDLVVRAKRLIDGGRVEYDMGNKEMTQSLMMISQLTTAAGHITYGANRKGNAGHADLAWGLFHALMAERNSPESKQKDESDSDTTLVIA